jgi:hypothetical protein
LIIVVGARKLPGEVAMFLPARNPIISDPSGLIRTTATKVSDVMNIPGGSWSTQISPEHNQRLSIISRIKHNISDLMDSYAWDDFDIRIAKSIDACKVNN